MTVSVATTITIIVVSMATVTTALGTVWDIHCVVSNPNHGSHGNNHSKYHQNVVDNGGNVAADSNSVEGLGSVSLLS